MNADQIGIALKGRRNGSGWLVCCPCPNHGKGRGDRSPRCPSRMVMTTGCCFAASPAAGSSISSMS